MGTRYLVSRKDIEENLRLTVEKTGVEYYGYDEEGEVVGIEALNGFKVAIDGWLFESHFGMWFMGPEVGKPDLDAFLKAHGVKPDWC